MQTEIDALVAELADRYTRAAKCLLAASFVQHLSGALSRWVEEKTEGPSEEEITRLGERVQKFPGGGREAAELVTSCGGVGEAPSKTLEGFLRFLQGQTQLCREVIEPSKVECGKIRLFLGLPSPFTFYGVTVGSFHELAYEMGDSILRLAENPEGDGDSPAGSGLEGRWRQVAASIEKTPRIDMQEVVYAIQEEYQASKSIETRRLEQLAREASRDGEPGDGD